MNFIQQIAFFIVFLATCFFLFRRIREIKRNIGLGKEIKLTDHRGKRLKNMMLIAFGQKKMFKKWIPAILHLFIYVGFLVINLEVLEFAVDGFFGTHRFFAPFLGSFYSVLMNVFEFFAVLVLFSCLIFIVRRNILKIRRFHSLEMKSWPTLDANLILIIEIVLMVAIFSMNAADQVLQLKNPDYYLQTGNFYFSGLLIPFFQTVEVDTLALIERFSWWFHICGIFFFTVYITYSKHLHILLAFPNAYYSSLSSLGKTSNMEAVTKEVNLMLGTTVEGSSEQESEVGRFGAKDVTDLNWINILNAYACTECGRCTSSCPANQTGKVLSPRKIMMDVRDRTEALGSVSNQSRKEENTLLDYYVTREEINACTTCNACVEACPININPLEIIIEMRRYVAMEESGTPTSWNAMFQNIETNFAPWKFSPADRDKWTKE